MSDKNRSQPVIFLAAAMGASYAEPSFYKRPKGDRE
jgi:hypothetical protein